jgi:hypothetical protein
LILEYYGANVYFRESLDPLYSPMVNEVIDAPVPVTLRRMSESFDMSPTAAIAV